jgi:hypothetical protein
MELWSHDILGREQGRHSILSDERGTRMSMDAIESRTAASNIDGGYRTKGADVF